ncbi:MAG: hypothetical protein AVDCRST_MAG89-1291, partial [uncultured Gemmatimonadetes bacterium]
ERGERRRPPGPGDGAREHRPGDGAGAGRGKPAGRELAHPHRQQQQRRPSRGPPGARRRVAAGRGGGRFLRARGVIRNRLRLDAQTPALLRTFGPAVDRRRPAPEARPPADHSRGGLRPVGAPPARGRGHLRGRGAGARPVAGVRRAARARVSVRGEPARRGHLRRHRRPPSQDAPSRLHGAAGLVGAAGLRRVHRDHRQRARPPRRSHRHHPRGGRPGSGRGGAFGGPSRAAGRGRRAGARGRGAYLAAPSPAPRRGADVRGARLPDGPRKGAKVRRRATEAHPLQMRGCGGPAHAGHRGEGRPHLRTYPAEDPPQSIHRPAGGRARGM